MTKVKPHFFNWISYRIGDVGFRLLIGVLRPMNFCLLARPLYFWSNQQSFFMKKLAICSVFLSFFLCYLEWGQGSEQSGFLFQAAYTIFFESKNVVDNFTHPIILLPFVGILLLLSQAFRKEPSKRWTIIGLALPGLLVLFLLFIGMMSKNVKIALSTLPFLLSVWWLLRLFRQKV